MHVLRGVHAPQFLGDDELRSNPTAEHLLLGCSSAWGELPYTHFMDFVLYKILQLQGLKEHRALLEIPGAGGRVHRA